MTSMSIGLLVAAAIVAVAQCRALPAEPLSIMMNAEGSPILMMRVKRQPISPFPHRAMMFTGYYRPTRNSGGPTTGVFAQGNAVSGGSLLGGSDPNYLQAGPEPTEDTEISSSEAEAAPETAYDNEQNYANDAPNEQPQEESQQDEIKPYGTEAPVQEESITPQTTTAKRPVKSHKPTKNTKKTTVHIQEDEQANEDDDDDNDDESDDEGVAPFVPFKVNHRGQMPNLNNFFPMVFTFPSSYGRRGVNGEGSPPGMITAIANSYSTGQGGVASSVATAYGGSPHSKKKTKSSQE